MRLVSPWRMDLLFLVSGAATSFMLMRGGAGAALLGTRARRLLVPLLFGVLVVVPPQSYLEVMQRFGYDGSAAAFLRLYFSGYSGFCQSAGHCLILPTWNHLWFIPYLFSYTLVLWAVLRAAPALLDRLGERLPGALRGARLLVVPVLLLVLSRIALRDRFPVTHALVDDWFAHSQHFAMFILGALLARAPVLWERFMNWRWIALALGIAAWLGLVSLGIVIRSAPWPEALLRPALYSVVQWCGVVAALGFVRRHLNRDGALRRYLTDAVFPVYIVHQTATLVLAHWLAPAQLDLVTEAPLLVLGTFGVSFLIYEGVRRVAWARPLFGLGARAPSRDSPGARAAVAP
jgi:hypothetical protein